LKFVDKVKQFDDINDTIGFIAALYKKLKSWISQEKSEIVDGTNLLVALSIEII